MIGDARRLVATLAAPYLPHRPTETVLYKLVRQNLESFLAYAREHYAGGLPRYAAVEDASVDRQASQQSNPIIEAAKESGVPWAIVEGYGIATVRLGLERFLGGSRGDAHDV
jgi:hypothetical protein